MLLNVKNTSEIGKRCEVFDANGVEVKYCLSCDTETGEVETFLHDGKAYVLEDCGQSVKRVSEFRPAPLSIKWLIRSL